MSLGGVGQVSLFESSLSSSRLMWWFSRWECYCLLFSTPISLHAISTHAVIFFLCIMDSLVNCESALAHSFPPWVPEAFPCFSIPRGQVPARHRRQVLSFSKRHWLPRLGLSPYYHLLSISPAFFVFPAAPTTSTWGLYDQSFSIQGVHKIPLQIWVEHCCDVSCLLWYKRAKKKMDKWPVLCTGTAACLYRNSSS